MEARCHIMMLRQENLPFQQLPVLDFLLQLSGIKDLEFDPVLGLVAVSGAITAFFAYLPSLVAGYYARKIFEPGKPIKIQGRKGILAGISPVHALIEEDGRLTTIPNSVFIEEAVRQ